MNSKESYEWKKAIKEELSQLKAKGTWKLITRTQEMKPVKNKWVFKVKKDQNGNVNRFKARLVAKGFIQQEGIDYQETFSPVVKFTTLRSLLAVANQLDWEIEQLDVSKAFLNCQLQKTILFLSQESHISLTQRLEHD